MDAQVSISWYLPNEFELGLNLDDLLVKLPDHVFDFNTGTEDFHFT